MTPDLKCRAEEVELVLRLVREWARNRKDVRGVALVGSQARGEAAKDSDVDLVILLDDPVRYAEADQWITELMPGTVVRRKQWGSLIERRVRLPSRLEVEINLARPSWAATDPVDGGTLAVVRDGMQILYDPSGYLNALIKLA
jgi:predicted nucleotidyltransferase